MRPLLLLAASAVLGLAALTLRPDLVPGVETEAVAVGGGVPSAPQEAAPGEAAPAPPVRTVVDVRPYAVSGSTAGEILASMVAEAPHSDGETFFGLTVTELSFRYRRRPSAAGCTLRDVQVGLSVGVSLPEWTPGPGAPYDLRRDWARFAASLRRHEDRHRELAEAGADAVRQHLDGLTMTTCTAADAEARRRAERTQIETEAAHRRYDDETAHGRTQGAVWP